MIQRLKLYLTQVAWAVRHTDVYAQDHCMWFQRMLETLNPYIDDFQHIRALDLGCGLLHWQTVMLHSLGANVTGLDSEYVRTDRRPDKYITLWKRNGLERAVKTAFWDYTFRNRYRRALRRCSRFQLDFNNLDVRQQRAEQMDFEADTFDLVVSHEVFEHIANVPDSIREIKRVLKPGGLAYINIHLFPSISGGHHMEWKFPDTKPSKRVPPWDHLRERRFQQHPSWINEMREKDYRPFFEEAFEIVSWEPSVYEGRSQLSPQIKDELADYSEDELLKKGIIVLMRKPE